MLILLLSIGLLLMFLSFIIGIRAKKNNKGLCSILYYDTDTSDYIFGVGMIVSIISGFVLAVMIIAFIDTPVISKKISLYEEENSKIEARISDTISNYMKYEKETYEELKHDDVIAIVSLYPELKSDELVQSQIDIYVQNNKKIIELKEKEVTASVIKWWIYFGD